MVYYDGTLNKHSHKEKCGLKVHALTKQARNNPDMYHCVGAE